jgi:protease I
MGQVAMIIDDMFEDSEMRVPYERLTEAGYDVVLVGREGGKRLRGKRGKETITTDEGISDVSASQFDALVIPGGFSPDRLRTDERMVALTRALAQAGKPVAAVCHAGSMLIEAGLASGRTLTSWESIKTDLINAGARWVDGEVVEDGNLITSRKPDDLPAFCAALLRQLDGCIPEPAKCDTQGAHERSC